MDEKQTIIHRVWVHVEGKWRAASDGFPTRAAASEWAARLQFDSRIEEEDTD